MPSLDSSLVRPHSRSVRPPSASMHRGRSASGAFLTRAISPRGGLGMREILKKVVRLEKELELVLSTRKL